MIAIAIICMLLVGATPQSTDFDVTDWTNDTTTDQIVVNGNTTTTTASSTTVNSTNSSNTTVSTTSDSIQQQLIDIHFLIIGLFFLLLKYIHWIK